MKKLKFSGLRNGSGEAKRQLPKLKLAIAVILLVIIGIAWAAIKSLQGPAVGTIAKPTLGANAVQPSSYIEQDGKYIVFNYREDYKLSPAEKLPANVVENYIFTKKQPGRVGTVNLNVNVYNLPGDKLEENSAYSYRKQNPQLYTERLSSINNYPVKIMKKKDGSETTSFIQHKDKVAVISLSGILANSSDAETEYTALLNSWHWK